MAGAELSSRDEQPVVVLVNFAWNAELAVVRDALTCSLRTPTVFLDQADLGAVPLSLDLGGGVLDVGGRRVRPTVVWVRHAAAGALVAQARPAGSMTPLDAESWSGFVRQIADSAAASLPGRTPVGPGQLRDARRLGVASPRTVVTNDVAAGVAWLGTPKVVLKTPDFRLFEPARHNWPAYLPAVVDRDALHRDRDAGAGPVVVQEYVDHTRELRIYYLNGAIGAFEVSKPEPSSLWTDPGSVTVRPVDCPPEAADAVQTLSTAWNLRYGAFDLLVSPTGEPVFLEANADGDWLWYERKADWYGVSFMAAAMVHELFVRSTTSGVRP